MIHRRGGTSVRIVGGGKRWMLGWLCGRGFHRCILEKDVLMGYFDGIFLQWANGCELGLSD